MRVETPFRAYLSSTILASTLLRSLDGGYFFPVFFGRRAPDNDAVRLRTLEERLGTLEKEAARREAEWLDVLDRFNRLYKRIVARQDRERRAVTGQAETVTTDEARSDSGESTLALKRRLRG